MLVKPLRTIIHRLFEVVQSKIDSGDQQKIAKVQGQLVLKPKPSQQITFIQSWTDAFLSYAGIYLTKVSE